jgi:hypothetical protein
MYYQLLDPARCFLPVVAPAVAARPGVGSDRTGRRRPAYLAIRFAAAIAARTPDFSRIALTFTRSALGSRRTAAM